MSDPRALLETERTEVLARLRALGEDVAGVKAASLDTNADDEHDPEGQTIAFERSQLQAVEQHARRRLAEVEAALARVEAGSYGVCEVCGAAIPAGRLDARPTARTCVEHT